VTVAPKPGVREAPDVDDERCLRLRGEPQKASSSFFGSRLPFG
jgi:hypothetical protein